MKDDSYLTINGKDEIYARLCVEVQNFDYAHIKMRLKLKNGKFFKASTKSYNLMEKERIYLSLWSIYDKWEENIFESKKQRWKDRIYRPKESAYIF